jgi:type II secretory pathway component GspD/PulD (secretin)
VTGGRLRVYLLVSFLLLSLAQTFLFFPFSTLTFSGIARAQEVSEAVAFGAAPPPESAPQVPADSVAEPANQAPPQAGAARPAAATVSQQPMKPASAGKEKDLQDQVKIPQASKGRPVALNFDDADVYSVMKVVFTEVLKADYVIDPRVKGRVTFRSMTPVPPERVLPLLEVVLRQNGIGIVEDQGLYRVVPISELAKEPADVSHGREAKKIVVAGKALVQVVPIVYVSSSEAIKIVTPFLSANAVLIDVPKGNQIIMVDTDANIKRLVGLIEMFDNEVLVNQKMPEVYVYHVQNGKAKDIATMLRQIFLSATSGSSTSSGMGPSPAGRPPSPAPSSSLPSVPPPGLSVSSAATGSESFVSPSTKIYADEVINSVVALATPQDYKIIEKTIRKLDVLQRQVVIEGAIAEVTLSNDLKLGIAWSFQAKIGALHGPVVSNGSELPKDANGLSGNGFTFVGLDSAGVVRAVISALANESRAKLLASPHILVSDNHEARIQVGQQVPIVTGQTYGTPGVAPIQTVQYKDIGIILKVKPQVNESGLVSMELSQEVSTFSTISLSAGTQDIILNKTEATTSLVVQSGETIIIGGLIREDTSNSVSGIPYLSKMPIIGYLFGDRTKQMTRSEIIILLTPRVIKDQKQAKDVTSDFVDRLTSTSKGGIQKKDLVREKVGPDAQNGN